MQSAPAATRHHLHDCPPTTDPSPCAPAQRPAGVLSAAKAAAGTRAREAAGRTRPPPGAPGLPAPAGRRQRSPHVSCWRAARRGAARRQAWPEARRQRDARSPAPAATIRKRLGCVPWPAGLRLYVECEAQLPVLYLSTVEGVIVFQPGHSQASSSERREPSGAACAHARARYVSIGMHTRGTHARWAGVSAGGQAEARADYNKYVPVCACARTIARMCVRACITPQRRRRKSGS